MQKLDRAVLRIPKVVLPPEEVHAFKEDLRYDRDGLTVQKVKDSGDISEKTLFIEPLGSRLFYLPSYKSVAQSSVAFKSIVEISTAPDATPGLKKCKVVGLFPLTVKTGDGRYLAFLVGDRDTRDKFAQVIAFLVRRSRAGHDEDPRHVRIYDLWIDADRSGKGALSFYETQRILKKMNVSLSTTEIDKLFRDFDVDGSGTISYSEFVEIYEHLTQMSVMQPLFAEFVKTEPLALMKPSELEAFFREAQGEYVPRALVEKMIEFYTHDGNAPGMGFGHFSTFLVDATKNGWTFPSLSGVTHEMDHPFHHYYIATSHSTFLTGNQFSSDADADMYSSVLQQGCRAVEVEIWDGDKGEPMVGRGTGAQVQLRHVLRCVADFAFTTSPYPVFFMVEARCCDDQLAVSARLIEAAFGDALATWEDTKDASPHDLQNKIIVSYKHSPLAKDCFKPVSGCPELEAHVAAVLSLTRFQSRNVGAAELVASASFCQTEYKRARGATAAAAAADGTVPPVPESQSILQVTADLLDDASVAAEISLAARSRLVRIVPDMLRYSDSSNVQLTRFLGAGVSMVSLNYQGFDDAVRMGQAFFSQNGGCGYVLKPEYLRTATAAAVETKLLLSVTIIAGAQIPHPETTIVNNNEIVDPYVVVQIGGSVTDMEANPPLQTKVVYDNGFNPTWNQTFRFVLTNLDLVSINLRVMTKGDPIDLDIATASVPLSMLRLGYRAVPLRSIVDGTLLPSACLMCHFALDAMDDFDS